MTHRLNLNPFNNHRRSVHKARSTPCFLLLSLPWRSSHDMVPPPCISLPWTHAHTNAHTALPLSDYFPWEPKGHCDDHELEWNPSVPSPSSNHRRVASLCPKSHKRALMTAEGVYSYCVEAVRANRNHLMIPFSSTKQNDSVLTVLPSGQVISAHLHTPTLGFTFE